MIIKKVTFRSVTSHFSVSRDLFWDIEAS